MARPLIAALLALSFGTVSVGQQTMPATDADFHAAYCIPLLDEEISFFQTAVAKLHAHTKKAHQADSPEFKRLGQQHIAQWRAGLLQLEEARKRLSAYFIPRRTSLDLRARSEANLAAQTDWGDFVTNSGRCQEEWPFNPRGQLHVRMTFCSNTALIARVQSCHEPTWLPHAL